MINNTVLDEAKKLIYGDREKEYGHPYDSFLTIARFWSIALAQPISAEDVCICLLLMKVARRLTGVTKRDTIVDMAGYAGLIERLQEPHVYRGDETHDNATLS